MDLRWSNLLPKNWRKGAGFANAIGLEFSEAGLAIACADGAQKNATAARISYCSFHGEPSADEQVIYLQKLVATRRWRSVPCNVVLAPSLYQISTMEAPEVPAEELRTAVHWKLLDLFGRNPDELAFDVVSLPADAYRTRMITVAAIPRSLMAKIAADMNAAGLSLQSISTQETALHNLCASVPTLASPTALLAFYQNRSMLSISAAGNAYFSRALDKGLSAVGSIPSDSEEYQYVLDAFVLDVQRSLDFFESQLRKGSASQLYCLPTTSETSVVAAALSAGLAVPLSAFPLSGLLQDGVCEAHELSRCINAVGAALWRMGA